MYSLMIVDDESIILNGICDAVKASELPLKAIRTAQSGEEALRKMQEEPCDILLTDIRMPDMDGLAMAARVKEIWPEIRVIFLTGYQDFEYARAALRLKSDDFLLKPSADEKLFAAIDKVIKSLDREWMGRFLRDSGVCENSEKELKDSTLIRNIFLLYHVQNKRADEREVHDSLCGMLEKLLRPYCDGIYYEKHESATVLKLVPAVEEKYWEKGVMKFLEEIQSFFLEQLDVDMSIGVTSSAPADRTEELLSQWMKEYGNEAIYGKLVLGNELFAGSGFQGGQEDEKEESIESGNYVVRAIADYVKQHPEDDLSLGALSGKFRINPSYLSRIFPQETGQNVSEFIMQVRLEAAKKLLRETDLKVYEIAEKTGFGTPGYFTKVFHKSEKISPKNYRFFNGIK